MKNMQWLVNNKNDFNERKKYIENLISEKRVMVEKLKMEIASLTFLNDILKWD